MRYRLLGAAACMLSVLTSPASAAVIVGLYNTGVADGGAGWADGGGAKPGNGADLHWDLAQSNSGQAFTGSPINSAWIANDGTSRWITPSPQGDASFDPSSDGFYTYSTAFDLTGFNSSSASFDGRFAADNTVTAIRLNGQVISGNGGSFNGWTNFSSLPGLFSAGLNTLEFDVTNFAQATGNPTGLRVEFLNSSVDGVAGVVPEPATWAMLISGFGLIGGTMRQRRRMTVRHG